MLSPDLLWPIVGAVADRFKEDEAEALVGMPSADPKAIDFEIRPQQP